MVIVLLGAILGLETADTSTIGSVAPQLQAGLHISHAQVGLLLSVSLGLGALATLPVGLLVDRVRRVPLLAASIAVWSLALVGCGAAGSYTILLLFRFALGAISATAWPAVASLIGDYFGPRERGRIYGLIMAGELLGTGVGFGISGNVAAALSWRASFWALAVPGFVLAWAVWRHLPEPVRGGASRLAPGSDRFVPRHRAQARARTMHGDDDPRPERDDDLVTAAVKQEHIDAKRDLVLRRDPVSMSLWEATRYVLCVRTNVILILAGVVSYFFYAGLQTFATEFVRARFGLSQSVATTLLVGLGVGAVVGVLVGGRVADRLVRRGHINGRIVVPAIAFALGIAFFGPGLLSSSLVVAAPLFFLGAGALEATNSPLNAARLDIMHSRLWGRAEGVRTVLRTSAQAVAPVLFGVVADAFSAGGGSALSGSAGSGMHGHGLQVAFLIMLVPLALAAGILLLARRTYAPDVATAVASERRTARARDGLDTGAEDG